MMISSIFWFDKKKPFHYNYQALIITIMNIYHQVLVFKAITNRII